VPSEIREAYENAAPEIDFNNAYAGETRHKLDWFYGINLSRALMNSLKKAGGFHTMSIGRVQGPALSILAQREKLIADFVPQDYWEVRIWLQDTEFMHEKDRFTNEEDAKKAHAAVGKDAVIESVEKRDKKIWPYPPFDLTSLQLEAHRCFGISPSQTLALAQTLYENTMISYPRTSSQKLPPKLGLKRIIGKLAEIPEYKDRADKLIKENWTRPFQGKKDDPAHPAIHPTGQYKKLEGQEKKLYDLIVCRFLGVFAPPAEAQTTKIKADAGGEIFKTSGERIVERNWIDMYPYYKSKERELPAFEKGEKEKVDKKSKLKKKTKPAPRYTPASIISELEKNKLGTKATRSTIVDTLFKRNYVLGKSITVTDLGMDVWKVLGKYSPRILDPELTRGIEDDMEKIVDGKLTEDAVVERGKETLTGILEDFKKHEASIGKELLGAMRETEEKENNLGPCPNCGGTLRIIRLRGGRQFVGCSGYPKCTQAYPLPTGAYVTITPKVCEHCNTRIVKVRRNKTFFEMCLDTTCKTKADWGKPKKPKEDAKGEGAKAAKTKAPKKATKKAAKKTSKK